MNRSGANADRLGCDDFRRPLAASRRSFLHAGVFGTAGLSLGQLLRRDASAATTPKRGNSVIILWMRGGPSHIDMWDPEPDAPAEHRGECGSIGTMVPGVRLTDMLPMSAVCPDRWSIVRSLHREDPGRSHSPGVFRLGIDTLARRTNNAGRPVPVLPCGSPIR